MNHALNRQMTRASMQPPPAAGCRNPLRWLILAGAVALVCSACADPATWQLDGQVALAGHREVAAAGYKWLQGTVVITNTGTLIIDSSTFTVLARTDAGNYWRTIVSTTRILPGSSIWVTAEIYYADAGETLLENGMTVGNAFFE